jgi:hypothetical protein
MIIHTLTAAHITAAAILEDMNMVSLIVYLKAGLFISA